MHPAAKIGVADTTIFGFDGPSVLIAGAIVISAVIGAVIALFTIGHQRMIARKKAAYDLAYTLQRPNFRRSEGIFLERCERGKWKRIVKPKTLEDRRKKAGDCPFT